jgi:hypothetical protein
MKADSQETTPLRAAKLAYVLCAEQVLQDDSMANEALPQTDEAWRVGKDGQLLA